MYYIRFLLFFHWKATYIKVNKGQWNVCKGLHKKTENNWNSRSSHPGVLCKKSELRNFAKFTGKHLRQSFFLNKVARLKTVTLLKKRPWHRSFPVNFAKLLRTPFLVEYLRWLRIRSFLACQSIWYFSKSTIFSSMNIIFFGDAGDDTPRCIFSGQGHLCFFARRAMSCLWRLRIYTENTIFPSGFW